MNTLTGREIIDVLERFLTLEWFRCGVLREAEQTKYPPIVMWRCDEQSMAPKDIADAEKKVATAVNCFKGNVSWVSYFSGRNWVILPLRIKSLEDSGEYRSDTEILAKLGAEDPAFGILANEDLPALARIIEEYLSGTPEGEKLQSQSGDSKESGPDSGARSDQ